VDPGVIEEHLKDENLQYSKNGLHITGIFKKSSPTNFGPYMLGHACSGRERQGMKKRERNKKLNIIEP